MARALIVSAGTSSNEYLAQHIAECGFPRPVIVPSCGEARRLLNGSGFDLLVINTPLPDEQGYELALDAASSTRTGILILVKASLQEAVSKRVVSAGVLVMGKPFNASAFKQSVALAAATAKRLEGMWQQNEQLKEKISQNRLISKAKCLLIERERLSEADAHRYIEKEAMDSRRSRFEVAEEILQRYSEDGTDEKS